MSTQKKKKASMYTPAVTTHVEVFVLRSRILKKPEWAAVKGPAQDL